MATNSGDNGGGIFLVLIFLVLALLLYYFTVTGTKAKGGKDPSQSDIDCATGGMSNPTGRIIEIGNCTKPRIPLVKQGNTWTVPKPMKQKCFSSTDLSLSDEQIDLIEKGGSGPDEVQETNALGYPIGPKWYLNFQSGDNFCYTSPKWYPTTK